MGILKIAQKYKGCRRIEKRQIPIVKEQTKYPKLKVHNKKVQEIRIWFSKEDRQQQYRWSWANCVKYTEPIKYKLEYQKY